MQKKSAPDSFNISAKPLPRTALRPLTFHDMNFIFLSFIWQKYAKAPKPPKAIACNLIKNRHEKRSDIYNQSSQKYFSRLRLQRLAFPNHGSPPLSSGRQFLNRGCRFFGLGRYFSGTKIPMTATTSRMISVLLIISVYSLRWLKYKTSYPHPQIKL